MIRFIRPFLCCVILLGAVCLSWVADAAIGIPDDSWPVSWFSAPVSASASGIKSFQESPFLSARVSAGSLPPVAQRLPVDPVVVEPFKRIGRYGGTLKIFKGGAWLIANEPPVTMGPQVSKIFANYVLRFEMEKDCRTYTLKLRPGLRWSDGEPFTSADFVWYHENMLMNSDLTPVLDRRKVGLVVEAPDPLTVIFRFAKPFAFFFEELAHRGARYALPGHFLKNYHPCGRDLEALEQEAKKKGYLNWKAYFKAAHEDAFRKPIGTPTLRSYQLVSRSPTLLIYERNPYFHKIDPAGNQLPYIDRVEVQLVSRAEVIAAKASTGQVDFCADIAPQDIPLFKIGEKAYGYKTYMWNNLLGVDRIIQPNLTVEKPKLRKIFRDKRFRQALSLAINRDEINEIMYFGQATPLNTTLMPSSRYYEKKVGQSFVEFDPVRACRMLDEIGLKDVDGDGIREYADGTPLAFTVEVLFAQTTMELVASHWLRVGINVGLKQVNSALQAARARSNSMDMTVWGADRTTDILFPMLPNWFVPMYISWDDAHWSLWSHWYLSDGERGEEPIPEAKRLCAMWDEMKQSSDPARRIELGKQILRSQAENIWSIGTVGMSPKPLIVSDRLRNVAKRGFWGWDNLWLQPYHPATWYLDQGEALQ